jgi:hypothetical protein
MDPEDALELLGSKYKDHPKIRSYAISRLQLASNEDLILYLLQLVQALRYENFDLKDLQLAYVCLSSFEKFDHSDTFLIYDIMPLFSKFFPNRTLLLNFLLMRILNM